MIASFKVGDAVCVSEGAKRSRGLGRLGCYSGKVVGSYVHPKAKHVRVIVKVDSPIFAGDAIVDYPARVLKRIG